jgi:hypothetical protein
MRLYRCQEQSLKKSEKMISCEFVTGERQMIAQIYLKTSALSSYALARGRTNDVCPSGGTKSSGLR